MATPRFELVCARSPADWLLVRELFEDYAAGLGIDLSFQNFAAELAGLPGVYAAPGGTVLLAYVDGAVAGCGGFRPFPGAGRPPTCEMKRLYLRPGWRGAGRGRRLAAALMGRARAAGYASMLLDVFEHMSAARALYAALGFVEIAPYYDNPLAGAHYLEARLDVEKV